MVNNIEESHRAALLERIARMKQANWTRAEIITAVSQWPADWRNKVKDADW